MSQKALSWIVLLLGIACNAGASGLTKAAAARGASVNMLLNGKLILGGGLYGLAFLFYFLALARLPLNIAQPVTTAGAILAVGLIAAFFFGERFSGMQLGGYCLVALGLFFIVRA